MADPPTSKNLLVKARDCWDQAAPWDDEHDRHGTETLLKSIQLQFRPGTWRAFERQVREGRSAPEVADEMSLSVNAVLIAKSRVLKRLREKAAGLIDVF